MIRRKAWPAGMDLGDAAWSLALALAVVLPLWLGRGFWLVGDMVFVPHQPWKPAWLGLDGSLPRAVPMDALVSLAEHVVPGEALQRLLLTGGFVLGGVGIGRLVGGQRGTATWPARAAAVTLFLWNPWVAERLGIGQWGILLGYLALPWVALAALRLRADPRAWGPAAVALVVAGVCTPSSGVMAAGTLLVLAADRRTWWRIVLIAVIANLPWLIPAATATSADVTTRGVFGDFAARAESAAGVVPSVLSLGGIWKSSIIPADRTSALLVLASCVLTLVAVVGLVRTRRSQRGRLAVVGTAALILALLPAVPGGAHLLEHLAAHLPALALLRDSQRFLAPLGLVLAVGLADAVTWIRRRIQVGREALWGVIGLLVVAPILLLPDLGWGIGGDLARSSYPAGWQAVADRIAADPGTTVVLPWQGSYRSFTWDHGRALLDPAPRYLPGEVLVDDRTLLTDAEVPAEDPRSETVRSALATADPAASLRALGVRWVLVEGTPDAEGSRIRRAAATSYDGDGLTLLDLGAAGGRGGKAARDGRPTLQLSRPIGQTGMVLSGDVAAFALLFAGGVWILRSRE